MQAVQANQFQSLRAAQKFLDDNSNRLPDVNDTGARRRLDALLAGIGECATEQEGSMIGGRGETRRYQALRRALVRDHMTLIARIAQYELACVVRDRCDPEAVQAKGRLDAINRGSVVIPRASAQALRTGHWSAVRIAAPAAW